MADRTGHEKQIIQWGLFVVAGLCVLAAIARIVRPDMIVLDEQTLRFLGLAAAALVIREIGKIEFPGVKIERVREELRQVDKRVELVEERGSLPGRGMPPTREAQHPAEYIGVTEEEWDADPNKNKFGGTPEANGRVLEAKITPAAGPRSAACRVRLEVRTKDRSRPLQGKVTFHLHPTFGRWKSYDVAVVRGVAADEITAWGAFTVGAVADEGDTRLELDLVTVGGGTDKFYKQ